MTGRCNDKGSTCALGERAELGDRVLDPDQTWYKVCLLWDQIWDQEVPEDLGLDLGLDLGWMAVVLVWVLKCLCLINNLCPCLLIGIFELSPMKIFQLLIHFEPCLLMTKKVSSDFTVKRALFSSILTFMTLNLVSEIKP